jgi:hypothetical protein
VTVKIVPADFYAYFGAVPVRILRNGCDRSVWILSAVNCSTPVCCKSRKPKMLKKRNRKKTLKKIARES